MNELSTAPDVLQPDDGEKATMRLPVHDRDLTDRMDWQHAHRENQASLRQDPMVSPNSLPLPETSSESLGPSSVAAQPSSAALQDTIEAQFGLEILLKHRELRLIDQEIAKCQIALEQLRRCHVIPYPALSSNCDDMQAVANATGRTHENDAQSAPAWGVTTGPYTRHYRRWLIPDPIFGDDVVEAPQTSQPATFSERSVRASTAGKSSLASQSRAQRGAASTRLKAIPHGYPEAKDDKGPMIVKRSTDGQMVKLVCLDCRRSDFNSAQGFINHCRIAHSRNFQSHDAAAVACGEEVEHDQAGGIVEDNKAAVNSGAGLVHPLIRSAHVAKSAAPTPPMKYQRKERANDMTETPTRSPLGAGPSQGPSLYSGSDLHPVTPGSVPVSLRPSPQAPHLSALFARIGQGVDLEEEINSAKVKVDIDNAMLSDEDAGNEDIEMDELLQPLSVPASHSTRGPARPDHHPVRTIISPAPFERSPCARPPKAGSRRPKNLTNLAPDASHRSTTHLRGAGASLDDQPLPDRRISTHDSAVLPNLSPSAVEAYQAPSLVSDDDECENTHSECSSTADVAEHLEGHYLGMDFESHDDHDLEDLEGPGSSAGAEHLGLGTAPKGARSHERPSSLRSSEEVRDRAFPNERRVSFASPVRKPRNKGSK
ncbi:MAG: hypothetical protein Q9216_004386 [Gyalolechia sp. 2 TL-2023]